MLRRLRLWHVVVILLSIFVVSVGLVWAEPASGVVGDGTPESCDGNTLETVLATGGFVSFDCGPNPVSIAVNTMVIEKDATLDGDLITLWGEDLRQIFIVNPGVNFVLRNITLTGGNWYGDGGAITNYGNLTLESSTISSSRAEGEASRGGAIFNDGGTLSLYDSYLLSNSAGQYGGGIASNGGTAYMTRTTIQENYAPNGGGGLWNANADVTIEESHIVTNSTQSDGQGNFGGGLYNIGRMTVRRTTIDYNSATDGGGIYSQGGGSLRVEDSTITGNSVTNAAGALQLGDGAIEIVNTTISGNTAGLFAGGVEVGSLNGSQSFQNVTIYGNRAPTGANFYQDVGEVVLSPSIRNTIIARPLGDGANCAFLRRGTSLGNNLSDDESCYFDAESDQQATDPLLGPLSNNGGPTLTHLPGVDSPAINAGDDGSCPAADQRGYVRPAQNICDIGAVDVDGELNPATATPTSTATDTATATRTSTATHTGTSTPTATNSPTPSSTPTASSTATATQSPTLTITPTATKVPTPNTLNYTTYAIEVTQGIQDLSNTVPLIRGKTAWVRAYVRRASGASSPLVSAQLWHIVNNQRVGSPVYPSNPGGKLAPPTSPNRSQLGDAFYFPVPSAWLNASTLQVEVTVNPSKVSGGCGILCFFFWWRDADETNYNDNTVRSPLLNLQVVPTMRLKLYNVVYSRNNTWYKATSAQMDEIESWLRRAYPISSLIVYRYETTMPESSIYTSGKDDKGNPTYYLDAGKVNQRLDLVRNIDKTFNINFRQQDRYYGVATNASGDFMRGLGGGYISSGPTGPRTSSGWQWELDSTSYGDWYAGHEIGHTWGRGHPVPAGYVSETNKGCGHSRSDPNYPYANAVIGGYNTYVWLGGNFWLTFPPSRYYGFDVALRRPVVRGPDWTDVMSYCQNEWMSDYTYNGIRAQMQAEGFAVTAAQVMAPAGDFLLIQGQIAPDGNSASLGEILTLPAASQPLPDPGAYSLELRGGGGTLLASHSFTPTVYAEEGTPNDGIGFVNLVIPAVSGIQTIELRRGETLLASRTVSAHPPTATLDTPNGGESIGPAGVTVSWQMADEDNDPLTAAILFSPDNGASWQTLQTGITDTTSVDIPYSLLTGTEQGRMRVLVSDGVQTAMDDSDAVFSVQRNAPEVAFLSPLPDSSFVVSQTVALAASAYDKEDGQLTDAAFAWSSDRDGALGTGAALSLDTLSAGQHVVSVTATDSDGSSTTVTRTVAIGTDVTSAPNLLAIAPQTVQLVAFVGTTGPVTGTLAIRDANASTGVTSPLTWTASDDAAWLSLEVSAGTAPSDVTVSADPSDFTTGIYTGTVSVQAGVASQSALVSLEVVETLPFQIFAPVVVR
jgi:predicted outer membrane repeat protein